MQSPPTSYANAASSSDVVDGSHRPLGYSVDRRNSAIPTQNQNQRSRLASVITIGKSNPERSRLSGRLSRGSVDTTSTSIKPSLASRRASLAQNVLDSISSRLSEPPSGASTTLETLPTSQYDGPILQGQGKRRKKQRPKNRRHRSSLTRDHGDFLASRAGALEHQPVSSEPLSPLQEAISEGDLEAVRNIITDKSHLSSLENIGKPLHAAALAGNEAIFNLLLESGDFKINDRDSRERTALYAARSRGHESIAQVLLANGAKELSFEESRIAGIELKQWLAYESQMNTSLPAAVLQEQTIKDAEVTAEPDSDDDVIPATFSQPNRVESEYEHIYKLEVGSCENIKDMEGVVNKKREDAQKRGKWVKGPIPTPTAVPQDVLPMKHKHVRFPGFGFEIPIVEFDFTSNRGHRVISPAPTVDNLLYGVQGVDSITRGDGPSSDVVCRWYHIPVNHLGWAEDLIRKIYEKRSLKEQQKRDVILRREPFSVDSDPLKPILLDPRPQARSLRPLCRNMTLDRDGNTRMASALNLRIPFVHWETEANRSEMQRIMETVREAYKHDLDNPNLQRKIPDLKIIQSFREWTKNEKLLCAYLYSTLPVHPRRTLDQFYYHMLEDTEHRDQDQVITRYYHNVWRRNHELPADEEEYNFGKPTSATPESAFNLDNPDPQGPEASKGISPAGRRLTSVSGNQMNEESPSILQSRRNTKIDEPEEEFTEPKEQAHVLMVDQLWLWILDENTIITSFPQNWTHDVEDSQVEGDPQDVLKSIQKYLTLVNRPPLESVYDLAQLIVYKCLATFCNKPTPYRQMQILDVYESAIASVTDEETKLFNKFANESKDAWSKERTTAKHSRSPEELYNIDKEIEQLKEIKDIQDELHILSVLLESQLPVLQEASDALSRPAETSEPKPKSSVISQTGGSLQNNVGQTVPYSSEFDFERLHKMVQEQEVRVKGLKDQAEQANKAVSPGTLDGTHQKY
ncbi:hypothetical protein ONS96_011173 [Cadophora gregata f. sp. sojae]|nr:hypothetical protein ONS96_011173 [Cadophora gregata f. sp. sojae]